MAGFAKVCRVADVPEGEARHVDVDGVPVAVVHTEGEFYACRDVCTHEEVPLSEGDVEGTTVECWLHGSRFDLLTGAPIGLPATVPVQTYPVKIDGEDVLVATDQNS
ncbi:MAG: bifunctional 3-phenylpropionate/cinnamic acid dioxygenase ferredoxin subunit [Streptosporangiales bacterium]|nr:bifunctional 3-phenylpropionate/cinnamic acid dioxygenase ferredoxin subunit [Streptosporangiales bacterium]MBO0892096.1 bifunctional 3-phenylpropionate/cinnamic acid dioxygenase ferredoxin subunit [Acidothermales bacterium]